MLSYLSHVILLSLTICFLNSSLRSPSLAVSASDDRTARLWDTRVRGEVGRFEDEYQITAVAYANDGQVVYTGGIDNGITAWDVRQMRRSMTMKGHSGRCCIHIICTILSSSLCHTYFCN